MTIDTRMLLSLAKNGINHADALALRRISMTLHRWNERECNGEVERDETSGLTYCVYGMNGPGPTRRYRCPDAERGAQRRLAAIMARYPELIAYEQGDPRGAALYIIPQAELNGRDIDGYYSSVGIAVYK